MKFQLKDVVTISGSGEQGDVIGRAEYATGSEPQYLVRYVNNANCLVENWWPESVLG